MLWLRYCVVWLQGIFNPEVLRVLNEAKGALLER